MQERWRGGRGRGGEEGVKRKEGGVFLCCQWKNIYFSSQSFAFCKHQVLPIGSHLPFCLDLSRNTFEKLDLLLRVVCEGLDGALGSYPPPHQDQECMATAALNLLCLQVSLLCEEYI